MTATPSTTEPAGVAARARRALGGIRARVVVGATALVAAALAIGVVVTWQVLLARLDRGIDAALVQEVEELRLLAAGTDPATGDPFGDDVAAIFEVFLGRSVPADHEAYYTFVDGEPFLRSFDAPTAPLSDADLVATWTDADRVERGRAPTDAGEIRWIAAPLTRAAPTGSGPDVAGTFVAGFFPAEERSEVFVAVRVVAITGAVVLVLAAASAWSLAGRVLRPVRRLTETARGIHDADLSQRIPVSGHDELAELGRTFNAMVERLDEGFALQRSFLDDVAHELRTPITIAQGHLDLLTTGGGLGSEGERGDGDGEDVAETVAIVRDELDRMSRYVADLLVLAKAERPDFLHLEPVDLGELAETLLDRVRGWPDRRWVCDAAPPPGRVAAIADPARLEQAVLNLAGNAVEHTAEGAEIGLGVEVVSAPDGGEHVRLWVRDSGPGVDPDVLDTLFVRHTRGASSRSTRRDGTGLGLSIVDAIARGHGGRVQVSSRPGAGATFTITVPLDAGPPVEDTP